MELESAHTPNHPFAHESNFEDTDKEEYSNYAKNISIFLNLIFTISIFGCPNKSTPTSLDIGECQPDVVFKLELELKVHYYNPSA